MVGGPSLKQKIKQKLLKPKYTPHNEEEALHLCSTVRSGSADIVLDALTPATSRGSSRPASTEPTSQDAHGYHDITASLLVDDAAAARKNDQVGRGSAVKATPSSRGPFKGCLPFGKPVTANEGLPTAFNNRQSILGRLNKAAKKPAQPPPPPPQAKPKPAGKAAVKPKVGGLSQQPCWSTKQLQYASQQTHFDGSTDTDLAHVLCNTALPQQLCTCRNMSLSGAPHGRRDAILLHCHLSASSNVLFSVSTCVASHMVNSLQKCQHPLHMAAWRTNITELQDQLVKPGADVNKRDKVRSLWLSNANPEADWHQQTQQVF